MMRYLKTVFVFGSFVVSLLFALFVINQTVQVVDLASRVKPILGVVVLWTLLAVYTVAIIVPVVLFLRLPAPLRPPKAEDSLDFPRYLEALRKRLSANRHVNGRDLTGREGVEGALAFLNSEADQIVRATASKVFITTGISQSGRLDALLVLSALSQMVWQIAHLYYQRPTPRDVMYLYGNVGATVFLTSELQDVEVHEHIEPILASTFGSAVSTLPGTALLVNSMLTAAGNAFLTLRVGAMAKRYCGSLTVSDRRSLRREATAEAVRVFGAIVSQSTSAITKALWEVSKKKVGNTLSETSSRLKRSAKGLSETLFGKEMSDSVKKSGDK
jgi:hypothetical protein